MKNQYESTLEEIEQLIEDDILFQSFQRKIATFRSSKDMISQLSNLIGMRKGQILGEKFWKEITTPEGKQKILMIERAKLNILDQIEEEIGIPEQFKKFQSKIQNFKDGSDVINELVSLVGKKKAQILGERFYNEQIVPKVKQKEKNYQKTLLQIENLSERSDFQVFSKKIQFAKSLQDIIAELVHLVGKKKAQILGQRLYNEGHSEKIRKLKLLNETSQCPLQQIESQINDRKQFAAFLEKLEAVKSAKDIINQLTKIIGVKKARVLGEKLYKDQYEQIIKKRLEKDQQKKQGKKNKNKVTALEQIEDQVKDEQVFKGFLKKIPQLLNIEDVTSVLSRLIGPKKAKTLGQKLYHQQIQHSKRSLQARSIQGNEKDKDKQKSRVLEQIQNIIGNRSRFDQFKLRMHDFTLIQDLTSELSQFMGKGKAKDLAKQLFKELGKDKIIVNKIQYLYRDLRLKQIDDNTINKISHLIQKGKKTAVQRALMHALGSVGGKKAFSQYQSCIIQRTSVPAFDSKFINFKNGLQIYEYKERLIDAEKLGAKTLIVFGETGCGKSTFLNAIVNYLTEIQMEDAFRYKIIIENEEDQRASITSQITSYYIKNSRTNMVYRLIDTPGFGDTSGFEKDVKIVNKVKETFTKEIDSIHNILFLMKASTTRVTAYQQYVFQSIMDLFNKDIAPNFVFIFTFSDSGKPQVLQSVEDPNFGFGRYWSQISEPKYLQVNNCGIFEKIDLNDKIKLGYWEIGMYCMDKLFEKVHLITPKSLYLSRELLKKKDALTNQMRATQETIQLAITKRQNLFKQIQKVLLYQQQIDNNRNFEYEVDSIQWYTQSTNHNVTRCINCQNSNCHLNCSFGDQEDKKNCCAFEEQVCKVCPGKCHYTLHRNEHYLRKTRTVKEKRQNAINKSRYENSCQGLKLSQSMVLELVNNIQITVTTVIKATKQMVEIQKHLVQNQMSTKKPESTISYLQHLIAIEQRDRNPGYQGRVKNMNDIIKQMKFFETLTNKPNEQIQNLIKGHQKKQFDQILKKAKPGFLQSIKQFFS